MNFSKTTQTTLETQDQGFTVRIANTTPSPQWWVEFIDYDLNCGAQGCFESLELALQHMPRFLVMAMAAYDAKFAKYGNMPLITLRDGVLWMSVEPETGLA